MPTEFKTYEGVAALVHEKMQRERPTLREYLRERCTGEDKSSHEWAKVGAKEQAAYRSGCWYAYRDIERMLEQDGFSPE